MTTLSLPTPKAPFTPDQYKVFQEMLASGAPKKAIALQLGCSVFKVNYWSNEGFRNSAIEYRVGKAKELRALASKKAPKKKK